MKHFGRTDGATDTGVPQTVNVTNAHLYRVAAANNYFEVWFNTTSHFATNINSVGFANEPTLGSGPNGLIFRGHISEAMFFNRVLSSDERDIVISNYLRQRYALW